MKDDTVHRVPEGRVPLAFDVQPAEARGRRLHDAERGSPLYDTSDFSLEGMLHARAHAAAATK